MSFAERDIGSSPIKCMKCLSKRIVSGKNENKRIIEIIHIIYE